MQPNKNLRLFLCGDVMTGRGIDQILMHPGQSQLYEPYVADAREYVALAENVNGKIPYPVSSQYIWGDALTVWEELKPDVKIINLETAITQHNGYWPAKGIHYRMHPNNIDVLTSAKIDICSLANNHVLDWGYQGLEETIETLRSAGIQSSGAGKTIAEAMQPAIYELPSQQRILVFSVGLDSSGVLSDWEATPKKPGIYYFYEMNQDAIASIAHHIKNYRKRNDLVILSIHWGSNWGYTISESLQHAAHALIDTANVDIIFGHSSHHPRPVEIYRGKPILYGCGDFMNDYEGIQGHEAYRGDLTFMYFLDFNEEILQLEKIQLIPMQIKNMRLHRASVSDCQWMLRQLNQSSIDHTQFTLKDRMLMNFDPG